MACNHAGFRPLFAPNFFQFGVFFYVFFSGFRCPLVPCPLYVFFLAFWPEGFSLGFILFMCFCFLGLVLFYLFGCGGSLVFLVFFWPAGTGVVLFYVVIWVCCLAAPLLLLCILLSSRGLPHLFLSLLRRGLSALYIFLGFWE